MDLVETLCGDSKPKTLSEEYNKNNSFKLCNLIVVSLIGFAIFWSWRSYGISGL